MAELALSYEGALDYEKLKSYPSQEVSILVETMNRINERKSKAIKGAKGELVTDGAIGDFGVS